MPKLSKEELLAVRQRAATQSLLENAADDPAFAEVDLSQYVNSQTVHTAPDPEVPTHYAHTGLS